MIRLSIHGFYRAALEWVKRAGCRKLTPKQEDPIKMVGNRKGHTLFCGLINKYTKISQTEIAFLAADT